MTTNNGKIIKYVLISVAVAFVLFIAYAVKESRKYPTPIGELGSTVVMSGNRPDEGTLRESKESSESKASEDREIPTTRYPGCDTDDIVLPDKSQKWSACNVGATKASMYGTCGIQSKELCPRELTGDSFLWGVNEPYIPGSASESSTGANVWGGITKDPELMRGPCAKGYRIPTADEVWRALSIKISMPFDPNAPWKPTERKLESEFQDFLKIPPMTGYTCTGTGYWCIKSRNKTSVGYFWTNHISKFGEHHPAEVEVNGHDHAVSLVNYERLPKDSNATNPTSSDYITTYERGTDTSRHALPVRCIKDDLYSN